MKIKTLSIYLLLMLVLMLLFGSCATDKMAYVSKDYEIYGTWVNPDYYDLLSAGVVVIHPNNIMQFYGSYDDLEKEKLSAQIWNGITGKWIDRKGNIWYTVIYIMGDKSWYYVLMKISDNGKTLESNGSSGDYPTEINPMGINSKYAIFYRE